MFSLLAATGFAAADRPAISVGESVAITNASQISGAAELCQAGHALWPRSDKVARAMRRFLNGRQCFAREAAAGPCEAFRHAFAA